MPGGAFKVLVVLCVGQCLEDFGQPVTRRPGVLDGPEWHPDTRSPRLRCRRRRRLTPVLLCRPAYGLHGRHGCTGGAGGTGWRLWGGLSAQRASRAVQVTGRAIGRGRYGAQPPAQVVPTGCIDVHDGQRRGGVSGVPAGASRGGRMVGGVAVFMGGPFGRGGPCLMTRAAGSHLMTGTDKRRTRGQLPPKGRGECPPGCLWLVGLSPGMSPGCPPEHEIGARVSPRLSPGVPGPRKSVPRIVPGERGSEGPKRAFPGTLLARIGVSGACRDIPGTVGGHPGDIRGTGWRTITPRPRPWRTCRVRPSGA